MVRNWGPAGGGPGNDRDDRDYAAVLVSAGVHRRADPMEWGQRIIELGAGACALSSPTKSRFLAALGMTKHFTPSVARGGSEASSPRSDSPSGSRPAGIAHP